jgi:hypothetical protein
MEDNLMEQDSNAEEKTSIRINQRRFKLILVIGIAGLVLYWTLKASPRELFVRWVANPIPNSVTRIRSYTLKNNRFTGYKYFFHFKIDEKDFDVILASRPFEPVQQFEYQGEMLQWRWDGKPDRAAYLPGGPRWFLPQELPGVQAYATPDQDSGGSPKYWVIAYSSETGDGYCYVCYSHH